MHILLMIIYRLTCPRGFKANTSSDLCSFLPKLQIFSLYARPFSLRTIKTRQQGGEPDPQ